MISAVCLDKEIKLRWGERKDKTEDMKYRLSIDGQVYFYTDKTYFTVKNLEMGREYAFTLELVKNWSESIGKKESCRVFLPRKWVVIDITKPPYNVVGDGKTDNTRALQKAFDDSVRDCKIIYFPQGEYLYSSIESQGNFHIQLDGGAKLCKIQ